MSNKIRCEAKNPATCRYHGTRLDESQWLPDYTEAKARLDDLNARVMSTTNGRTSFQNLEAERQQAILDVDASHEGMKNLNDKIEKGRVLDTAPNFWAEEKVREALAHREHKLADAAIEDFKGMKDEEYTFNTAERLFSGSTDAMVFEQDGTTVVSIINEETGRVEFEEFDLTKVEDRVRLIEKRREAEAGAVARTLYNVSDLRQDVLGSSNAQIDIGSGNAVLRQDGVPYARVEFNNDGTFKRAIASRSGGYSLFLESSTAFRGFVNDVIEGNRPLLPIEGYLAAR